MKKKEALQAVMDEPELPGPMPPSMRAMIRKAVMENDWDSMNELLRAVVRSTKSGIYDRIKVFQRSNVSAAAGQS